MFLRTSFVLMIMFLTVSQAQVSRPVKWACIGNSITQGIFPNAAYAPKLAKLLGPSYTVENDGVSSMTLFKSGKFGAPTDAPGSGSYWLHGKLSNVFALQPDIITIALGTNDSKSMNWADSVNFVRDYSALIDTLSTMPSRPQIWLCLPCPCWVTPAVPADIQNTVIRNSIIPRIQQVATAKGVNTIDFYTPMSTQQRRFPDNIHPDSTGGDSLAALIYRAYAAKAVRIACIGNSITQYGSSADVPDIDAYPSKLGMLLGRGYLVQNFGYSGAAMQKKNAGWSYWVEAAYKFPLIFKFKPNVVTIKLGTNDSRRYYWHTAPYVADYKAMVDTLNNNISPTPTIRLCLPIPAWPSGFTKYGINDTIIKDSVIPSIRLVAQQKSLLIIDLNTPMLGAYPALVPASDGVHPNAAGQDTIAHLIYRNFITASMQLSPTALAFSAMIGQQDTTGTRKVDTVFNRAIAGSLLQVTLSHKATWLNTTLDNTVPNVQKITNRIVLGSLPATPGIYYDTVTVTANNASPTSVRFVVTLDLRPATGVTAVSEVAAQNLLQIRMVKKGAISIAVNKPGKYTIQIMSVLGKILSNQTVSGQRSHIIEVKEASSGLYIVRVTSGTQIMVRRVVGLSLF
jgi:acyl-CoA thioesterase I